MRYGNELLETIYSSLQNGQEGRPRKLQDQEATVSLTTPGKMMEHLILDVISEHVEEKNHKILKNHKITEWKARAGSCT